MTSSEPRGRLARAALRFIDWNLRRGLRQIDRIEGLSDEARATHRAALVRMYRERLGQRW